MTTGKLFLDSAYAIALVARRDALHSSAVAVAERLIRERVRVVTTRAVILEIGSALARARHRAAAISLLTSLEADPNLEIVPLTRELLARGLALFRSRPDKEWSLTDCISFVVMADRRITQALTSDDHFRQAGFTPLLQPPSDGS